MYTLYVYAGNAFLLSEKKDFNKKSLIWEENCFFDLEILENSRFEWSTAARSPKAPPFENAYKT